MQRADTFWPLQLLEFHLSSVTLQAEGDKSRKGGPLPVPGWKHYYRPPDFLACATSHNILWRRQRCEQRRGDKDRSGWMRSPEKRPSKCCPSLALGLRTGLTCLRGTAMLSRLCSLPWTSRMLSCSARTVPTSHVSNSWGPSRVLSNLPAVHRHTGKGTQEAAQLGAGWWQAGAGPGRIRVECDPLYQV